MDRVLELGTELRRRAGAVVADSFWAMLSAAGKLHPLAAPERHGIKLIPDVAYTDSRRSEHRLDVYQPRGRPPWPVVLYVHGGGFRILSKDSHWAMATAYASRGYLVFNVSYRLAPEHRFPAAVEDVCAAYLWLTQHAAEYGGDLGRLVLAGESAGSNLVTVLALCASYQRSEPYARAVWDTTVRPRAVVAACGVYQVSDMARFARRRALSVFVSDRLVETELAYLGASPVASPELLDLANPLCFFQRSGPPPRPLPAFFAPVGTRDPMLDDTRRLKVELERLGAACEARYYPGGLHVFHAVVLTPLARRCWRDTFAFLDEHLGG